MVPVAEIVVDEVGYDQVSADEPAEPDETVTQDDEQDSEVSAPADEPVSDEGTGDDLDATAGEAVEPAETPQVHNGADQDHETMVGTDPEEGS